MGERSRNPREPVQPEPPFFIFDGECGFCRKWAAWLGKRLPAGTVLLAFQQIDNLAAFGLTESEVSTASYWIDTGGTAHGGADSFAYAPRGTGLPWSPFAAWLRAPVIRSGARLGYQLIARNSAAVASGDGSTTRAADTEEAAGV